MWGWHDRYTYICLPCRFTSKYPGRCGHCGDALLGLYNFQPPRKRDDRGWKKIELGLLVHNSGIQLCTCFDCVPLRRPRWIRPREKDLTLSQYRARVRKQREHRQDRVPQHNKYK